MTDHQTRYITRNITTAIYIISFLAIASFAGDSAVKVIASFIFAYYLFSAIIGYTNWDSCKDE